MADPVSIASGVAGCVSLGITLCNGLHTFLSAIKDRDKDLENAIKENNLLRFHLTIIESNKSRLPSHHALAAEGINLGLKECESQLTSLEKLIGEMTSSDALSGANQLWRKQKMVALYPFDKKRLGQLQSQLSKANNTLSSFVQALNLEVTIDVRNSLQGLVKGRSAEDMVTHTLLSNMSETIVPTVQRTEMRMALVHSRLEQQAAVASSSHALLNDMNVMMKEMQLISTGGHRRFEDDLADGLQPRYPQNSESKRDLCSSLAGNKCACASSTNKLVYRRRSRIDQYWGPFAISRQEDVQAHHHPGCVFFTLPKRSQKSTMTFSGLRSIFSQTLTISLERKDPVGAYSLSFGLQPCNVVASSPAFQIFAYDKSTRLPIVDRMFKSFGVEETTKWVIRQLRQIYSSGDASPFDVDQDGNNVAFFCLAACIDSVENSLFDNRRLFEKGIEPIYNILSFMIDIGVPVTASNFDQTTLFNLCTESFVRLLMLPRLYSLITDRDPAFYPKEFAHKMTESVRVSWYLEEWFYLLDIWSEYTDISEAAGFSDIFLAVLRRDQSTLEKILCGDKPPASISYQDNYERNILHVSSNWASGLVQLLKHELTRPLLNATSMFGMSPLDHALLYTKVTCNAQDQWTPCQDCSCYLTVKLLLESGCSSGISLFQPPILTNCSLRARRLFFEHLKHRRQRLRDISLDNLPSDILSQYGITAYSLPNATASLLWDELEKRADILARRGVRLSDSLKPPAKSFFAYPHSVEVAELALEYGLQPVDECGVSPLMSQVALLGYQSAEASITYIAWLLQHDLKLDFVAGDFQLSAIHRSTSIIGTCVSFFYRKRRVLPTSHLRTSISLLSTICCSRTTSNLLCPCVSGIFNTPLSCLLSGLIGHSYVTEDYQRKRQKIKQDIHLIALLVDIIEEAEHGLERPYLAKCAIHILTMKFLGIRHLQLCYTKDSMLENILADPTWEEEECAEMLEEDQILIGQLHALDGMFGEEFHRQNISIADFLQRYWLEKMEEAGKAMDMPLSDDYRRDLRQVGVVLEEDEESGLGSEEK